MDEEVHSICDTTMLQINSLELNYNSIRNATKRDAQLLKIMTELRSSNVIDTEYTIDSDILFIIIMSSHGS